MATAVEEPPIGIRFRFWMGGRVPEPWRGWAYAQVEHPLFALRVVVNQFLMTLPALAAWLVLLLSSGRAYAPWALLLMPVAGAGAMAARMLNNFEREKANWIDVIEGRRRSHDVPSARFLVGLLIVGTVFGVIGWFTLVR